MIAEDGGMRQTRSMKRSIEVLRLPLILRLR